MPRPRVVDAQMDVPAHGGVMKKGVVMTETAVHTIELAEGHFACMVQSRPNSDIAAVTIMDRDEVEALILLLRNATEDAELLDAGKEPKHAAPSLTRQ